MYCVIVEGIAARGCGTRVVRSGGVYLWYAVVEVVALDGFDVVVRVCVYRLPAMQSAGQQDRCSRKYGDRGRSAVLAVSEGVVVREEHEACRGGQGRAGVV